MKDKDKALQHDPGREVKRKDKTEDIGFIARVDPWERLAELYGPEFKEYRRKWALASDLELELDFPLQLDFELNNTCNLKCAMCTWSYQKITKVIDFPGDKFKEIVTDGVTKGLRALDLSFVNEPLIRKDIPELVAFARAAGILDISFNTNAMLLDESYSRRLLEAGLTRIQFSIDAHSAASYDQLRHGGDFNRVCRHVLDFLRLKEAKKVNGLLTSVSFIRTGVNEHELSDFVKYWEPKVDYVIVREYLSPHAQDAAAGGKDRLFADQRRIAKEFKCNKPWQRLVVRADGTVLPCCVFQAVQLPVGNVFKSSLEDIWHSNKMKQLRKLHKAGEYFKNKTCFECATSSTA